MVMPADSSEETVYDLIASPASGSTEVTQAITYSVEDWFTVSRVYVLLYCGTFDADSTSNTLVSSTPITKSWDGLGNGTYSSAPLIGLTISPVTLSPDFDRGRTPYSAQVPSNTGSNYPGRHRAGRLRNHVSQKPERACHGPVLFKPLQLQLRRGRKRLRTFRCRLELRGVLG